MLPYSRAYFIEILLNYYWRSKLKLKNLLMLLPLISLVEARWPNGSTLDRTVQVQGRAGDSFYSSNLNPLYIMQKKTIRIITFSTFDAHTSPLFSQLHLLKLHDYIKFQTLYFMYQFEAGKVPSNFDSFFIKTSSMHNVLQPGLPFIYQKFALIMASLILDIMGRNYGMNLMRILNLSHLIHSKKS